MKLIINAEKNDVTANDATGYMDACRKIDAALAKKRSISVASTNPAVIRWLITLYEGRCTIIIN